ncbi:MULTISPECIES: hypothetical protein [Acinetobacter]|uniref:Uncharacterized protein n=1 Tax=Acinetobacter parvus DSM 16617 = CIP 108168 TaxID=981333 RepID=N8QD11_9GAMM|nr:MULTISPECIES: hypothetical protein [Acinetobacter]ENU36636.1 hypothetical protein F988_01269 [Acinetobacter parvus DSM 16617 = CIP 108168]ENU84341.1 hypothetical protein F974_00530 [Acinetobacter sp. CIP 102159]ENU89830.1 hypothetical protein F972_00870 [Acinetobacter sp. CIP 102529]ENU94774.1 hypothetical protein F970_02554 [Acinetobacter sp. CIP 102082]ENX66389.1 hypothetical protein F884_01051 [Acinetobacter sp. CIP 102143]
MEVVILTVIAIIAAFAFLMKRGVKAVQAYVYLAARLDGKSEAEANDIALRLDTHSAGHLNDAMRLFCQHCYGGRQLAMISGARLDGFKG